MGFWRVSGVFVGVLIGARLPDLRAVTDRLFKEPAKVTRDPAQSVLDERAPQEADGRCWFVLRLLDLGSVLME